jgi:hypothetical protein
MEVNVFNHWYVSGPNDRLERSSCIFVRAGYANDIATSFLNLADLINRGARVAGDRVGHGLHADWRIAANHNWPDVDLLGLSPRNVAVGAKAHEPVL